MHWLIVALIIGLFVVCKFDDDDPEDGDLLDWDWPSPQRRTT